MGKERIVEINAVSHAYVRNITCITTVRKETEGIAMAESKRSSDQIIKGEKKRNNTTQHNNTTTQHNTTQSKGGRERERGEEGTEEAARRNGWTDGWMEGGRQLSVRARCAVSIIILHQSGR